MEAHAEGLEGRPHHAEVLATFSRPRQRNLKGSLKQSIGPGERRYRNVAKPKFSPIVSE